VNPQERAVDVKLQLIINEVFHQRGMDLQQYKVSFIARRLEARMRERKIKDYEEYASLLKKDTTELPKLYQALSINVTEFFRDKDVFDAVSTRIIPSLLAETSQPRTIRVWSAGCATGEEAYSAAILLSQALEYSRVPFTVIGTDLSAKAIETAKHAVYHTSSLKNVPKQLLAKYFHALPEEELHQVCKEIRDLVSFSVSDLATMFLPNRLDLIFCRNVIIYFEREMQRRLFVKFHNSLNTGGYLILGKVELIIGQSSTLFEGFLPREKIYRRI
jgi:chemotaxis protein methyltransferase CheR